MFKNFVLSSLNKALNAYLDLDPESRERCRQLKEKIISIKFLPWDFTFYCLFKEDGIHLSFDESLIAETTIIGTPLQMLGLLADKKNRKRFFSEDVRLEGNAELGQQAITLFDHLKIDWEEHFSRFAGDAATHHASRLLRKTGEWLGAVDKSMSQNINEYVHEEAKWLPSREALKDFFADIDAARMDVDRLESRIKLIRNDSESF
jgi:ubiquinone biosynthesis accessory factor UbiJ